MNIIGKGSGNNFFIEIDQDEIANICGVNSTYNMEKKPAVGQTISVNAIYNMAVAVRSHGKTLRKAAKDLSNVVESIHDIKFPDVSDN